MEQAMETRQDYYDDEFKAFTQEALCIFGRVKSLYSSRKNGLNGTFEAAQETIYSRTVKAECKKYHIDINATKSGRLCLTVCEVQEGILEGNNGSRRIVIFDGAPERQHTMAAC
jgi:hypothetical protein